MAGRVASAPEGVPNDESIRLLKRVCEAMSATRDVEDIEAALSRLAEVNAAIKEAVGPLLSPREAGLLDGSISVLEATAALRSDLEARLESASWGYLETAYGLARGNRVSFRHAGATKNSGLVLERVWTYGDEPKFLVEGRMVRKDGTVGKLVERLLLPSEVTWERVESPRARSEADTDESTPHG